MLFDSFDHAMQDGKVLESAALEMVNHDGAKIVAFAVLAVLHLCVLRYFPSTNLVDRAGNCYRSLYFLLVLFFYVYSI